MKKNVRVEIEAHVGFQLYKQLCTSRSSVFERETFGFFETSGLTQLDFIFQEFRISLSGGKRPLIPEKEYFLFLFSHM